MTSSSNTTTRIVAVACLLACMLACGRPPDGGPPEVTLDVTACDHCRMLISEAVYAAGYRSPTGDRAFDDIGCLVAHLHEHSSEMPEVWVHDLEGGSWVRASDASFVRIPDMATPMGSGLVALRDSEAARVLAERRGGELQSSFAALLIDRSEHAG